MLAGCGGSQPPIAAADAMLQGRASRNAVPQTNALANGLPYHHTFKYTGKRQSFKVPAGVSSITVVALGAAGAADLGSYGSYNDYFGRGSRVYAVIPVTPGETLPVLVGGQGSARGGFNGGGNPGYTISPFGPCYGGGGASDVRENGDVLRDRVLVAAGGGGQGCGYINDRDVFGGSGGPAQGQDGGSQYGAGGGSGGTQSSGGSGGAGDPGGGSRKGRGRSGHSGALGHGGDGGDGGLDPHCNLSNYNCYGGGGGGGGGGYYGAGGGGGGGGYEFEGSVGGGGGGGSSYAEPSAQRVQMWRGWKTATSNGLVVFSW